MSGASAAFSPWLVESVPWDDDEVDQGLWQAYTQLLIDLLPPGRLFHLIASLLRRSLEAAARELARIGARAVDLFRESDPSRAEELLTDYEEELGLTPAEGDTLGARRARVVGRLVARQRVRPADYRQATALLLGQAPADVVVLERKAANAIAELHEREVYRFFIYRDPTLPGDYDLPGAQRLVDQISHSHTVGQVIESINFLCDDPYSQVDRDLLGV